MSVDEILEQWKTKIFHPVYWLEGDEEYYIDKVMHFAEHNILSESEAEFNLTTFYGKDADWSQIINACRRYPMFANYQLVLLKEGQQMKDIDRLEAYITKPLSSTIFVISYKGKLDGRSKLAKILNQQAQRLSSQKISDYKLAEWTDGYIRSRGFTVTSRALHLLVDHVGNDLSRIVNEFEKVLTNVAERKEITEDDIETFVGISKEYNAFEFQKALNTKDLAKAIMIIQYFEHNPKAVPIQMLLPLLYVNFSKIMPLYQLSDRSEKGLKPYFNNNTFAVKQALEVMLKYSYDGLERAILLLHDYNLKSIGINRGGATDASLLKELTVKIIN